MTQLLKCIICNKNLIGKQIKFCSRSCNAKTTNKKHQNYKAQRKRGYDRKILLIKQKGGKCSNCEYENYAGLCFHHINPAEKSFALDVRSLSNRTINKINKEAEKCILLCANCHAELHNPEFKDI